MHAWGRPRKDAPIVVALHGFTGSGLDWELPVEAFGNFAGAWYAPDLPGHGGSTGLRSDHAYSLEGIREALHAFIRSLPAAPILMGYSFGGRAALAYAAHHGDALDGLILIGATAGIEDDRERAIRAKADAALARNLEEDGIEAFADHWEALPLLLSQNNIPDPWRQRLRARRRLRNPHELARSLRAAGQGAMPPLWNELRRIPVPTLCAFGGRDGKFGQLAEKLVAGLASGFAINVADTGHSPHLENAAGFYREIISNGQLNLAKGRKGFEFL